MSYLDLFHGIGGFALGAYWAGMKFENHYCSDIEPYCQELYAKRFPDSIQLGDIRGIYKLADEYKKCECCEEPYCQEHDKHFSECSCIGASEWEDKYGTVDIISAGFPCQDISYNGGGAGLTGKRSGLWYEVVRLTGVFRPKFLIIENVAALINRGLHEVMCSLSEIGYDAEWQIISARDLGYPHKRERIWIVAYPQGNGVQGLRSGGIEVARPLEKALLSLRDSDGQWKVEPDVRRINNGIPGRMDRLKGLGNAIVPQIAELLFRQIKELL